MSLSETAGRLLGGPLSEGIDTLSQHQQIVFGQYSKFVLPADGFVFWVRSGSMTVAGSLHVAANERQEESETYGVNRVVFTSTQEIAAFNDISPTLIYIGTYQVGGLDPPIRFSFNTRADFYESAGLYHYAGDALYPSMASQIIDNEADFDRISPVVSNSLPIWLALNGRPLSPWNPPDWGPFPIIYPSFLVDDNLKPPFIACHIFGTSGLQPVPDLDSTYTHHQLASETVRFTCYGMRNQQALDFQDMLLDYSTAATNGAIDLDNYGLMGGPVMVDDKKIQSELSIIAQRKTFEMEISYTQARANSVARQLIRQARVTYSVKDWSA